MDFNQVRQQNVNLIQDINQVIDEFHNQDFFHGHNNFVKLTKTLLQWVQFSESHMTELKKIGYEFPSRLVMDTFTMMLSSQEKEDYVLLADQLELYMLPIVIQQQEYIMDYLPIRPNETLFQKNVKLLRKKNSYLADTIMKRYQEKTKASYEIEYTQNGSYTIKYIGTKEKECYFHSNVSPEREADIFVRTFYNSEYGEYIVIGFGLGYHVTSLLQYDETLVVDIVEPDVDVYCTAFCYEDYSELLENPQVFFYLQEDFHKLVKEKKNSYYFLVLSPVTRLLKTSIRKAIKEYQMQLESMKNHEHAMEINFRNNIARVSKSVEECRDNFEDKTVYIVAAGPSLDKNVEELRNVSANSTVLIVGTVFRKFLKEKIPFDYVIMTDGTVGVYPQIQGLEQENKPLFLLATCYYKVAKDYQGERYLIFQKAYKKSEQYAREKEYETFETGGSVLTTAVEVAISLGAKQVVLVGADLAFSGGTSHSKGTAEVHHIETMECEQIQGLDGAVFTSNQLNIYRKWIEQRIVREKNVKFYNATEGGAIIKGMKNVKLRDMIKQENI